MSIDPFSQSDDGKSTSEYQLPEQLGILPVRNAVTFPGTVMPLAIGRGKSKQLVADAQKEQSIIGLVTQRNPDVDDPQVKDLYNVGTAAAILKTVKMPQGTVNIIVHGLVRFKIVSVVSTEPYIKVRIKPLERKSVMSKKLAALMVSVRNAAQKVISLSPNVPEEAAVLLENIETPSGLVDFLSANLNIPVAEKQQLLEDLDSQRCLEKISIALANQLEVLELSHKIQGEVRESIDKTQREYYLQEQLKAIQSELGKEGGKGDEISRLKDSIKKAQMPQAVEEEACRELDKLAKMHILSPEYGLVRSYLEWMCELPWNKGTKESLDISKAQRILNRDHFGLKKVKQRILEFLAVRKLNPTGKSPILCFVGPPGVGKTSLGRSIASATGRKFVRISLGGIRDEADIRGHRRTYIGALPGRILQELRKCGSNNPVFMLEELDKIGADFRGDPASALLEVLDPAQNNSFTDHYLDQPFDLTRVMFIGTANYTEPVPPALQDRMEIIELPGYTENEKLNIAKKYLVPRQIAETGLTKSKLNITDEAILTLIRSYTAEAGVRNLEREIAAICRHIATKIAKGSSAKTTITTDHLAKILGPVRYESEIAGRTATPGVVTGLAYTPFGGEILFVESASMPGEGKLVLTGQIGDIMKESAQAAFSIVKSGAEKFGIKAVKFEKCDFHIHVPAGAVPKDGPSAGIAMFTSLVSLLTGKKVRCDVAMTGEITLKGQVLPVGGLKEKILAARRAGIKTIILPYRNKKNMVEVPKEAKGGIKFVFVKTAAEVLAAAIKS